MEMDDIAKLMGPLIDKIADKGTIKNQDLEFTPVLNQTGNSIIINRIMEDFNKRKVVYLNTPVQMVKKNVRSKNDKLLELKQSISLMEEEKRTIENEVRLLENKKLLSKDPHEKNTLTKKIQALKQKAHKLALNYDTAKELEKKTEESNARIKQIALEEEKQNRFINQNSKLIKLSKEAELEAIQKKKEADLEFIERRKEIIQAAKPDRKELQLLFQCGTVFDKLLARGIGFEVKEKRIIENLKEYLLSQ